MNTTRPTDPPVPAPTKPAPKVTSTTTTTTTTTSTTTSTSKPIPLTEPTKPPVPRPRNSTHSNIPPQTKTTGPNQKVTKQPLPLPHPTRTIIPHQNDSKTIPIPTKATLPYLNDSTDKSKNTTQNKPTTANKEEISEIIKPIIQSFHEQYKQNIEIQHENELAREIRQIYCQVSVLRRLQAMTLSQTNGILAAAALELPTCSRLQGLGQSLLLQECEKKQVTVGAIETKCGFQPYTVYKNNNYTIGTDGWSIHPFSNCFWKTNLVNLNGKTFHWEHNTTHADWTEQTPNIHTPNLNLVSQFEELSLNDFNYALKGHPAHSVTDLERLNVLNELIGRIEETHDNSLAGMIMSEKQDTKIGDMYSWTDYLKIIVFTTIGFIMFILVAYIFARVNPIPAMIDSFQQRRNRRAAVEIPIEQSHHMAYATNHPIIMPGNMYPYVMPPSAPIESISRANSFLNQIHL
jgi:hypothetical protein